ncbi:Xylulose kinase [Caprobacter fermentans]|uniref:Xylulose kinase n=1 Tax=Caproicibacter fermentans TaxID=2576756 RepID=A0A6N8HUM7_9FIRM|nr:FGGY-family carbohydrate kinase [Caproicibacter fermentans]MVB09494.1 Xylulose kinase [Caproicibacter fermentans]
MNYLLGTDIGTSGTKTILTDTSGNLIAEHLCEYDVLTPKPLWAEQWPDIWVDAVKESIRETVKKAAVEPEAVKALCISGLYGGSGIPLDSQMRPVRPCLIWMDRRAQEESDWALEQIGAEKLMRITHNGSDPYYGFTKMLWIKRHEPENWEKTKLFLPPNAYAIYRLTGKIAEDYSSAGNTGGIFDMNTHTWSKELLDKMGIPLSKLPQNLVESSDVVGGLTGEAAKELGLCKSMPVCAGGIDCGAANIGLGVFEPGVFAAAIGTSLCGALITDKPVQGRGLIEWPYLYRAKELSYCFAGAATAGAIVKWFRDTFAEAEYSRQKAGGPNAYAVLDRQAEKIPVGSGGLIVLPYFMGERSPVWDSNARGTIIGLSLAHTKAHIYRAFLEAVAYSLRDAIEATGEKVGDILVAGGAVKSTLWKQIFADVTGHRVVCPINDVEANLGDVMLAGLGTGLLTREGMQKWRVLAEPVEPDPKAHARYDSLYRCYKSIYKNLRNDMKTLSALN